MLCIGGYFGFQIQTIYYNNMFVAKENKKNISVSYGTFCILNPMVYWTPLLKNEPPLYGKLNPYCILNPLIFNQEIGRGFDIPWVGGGSIYYG
jgi:hypothetical protein